MITTSSKLPFGKHKGMPINQCPVNYLKWMCKTMRDTDFHEYAIAAEQAIAEVKDNVPKADLEEAANEFLRNHGIDPKSL